MELPGSPEDRQGLARQFLDSTAFKYAKETYEARIVHAWKSSLPHQVDERENLYFMLTGFQAMEEEVVKILSNAEADLLKIQRHENTRGERDLV